MCPAMKHDVVYVDLHNTSSGQNNGDKHLYTTSSVVQVDEDNIMFHSWGYIQVSVDKRLVATSKCLKVV